MSVAQTWPYPQTRQPNSRGFYGFGDAADSDIMAAAEPGAFLDPNSYSLLGGNVTDGAFPVAVPMGQTPSLESQVAAAQVAAAPAQPKHHLLGLLAVGAAAWFIFKKKPAASP